MLFNLLHFNHTLKSRLVLTRPSEHLCRSLKVVSGSIHRKLHVSNSGVLYNFNRNSFLVHLNRFEPLDAVENIHLSGLRSCELRRSVVNRETECTSSLTTFLQTVSWLSLKRILYLFLFVILCSNQTSHMFSQTGNSRFTRYLLQSFSFIVQSKSTAASWKLWVVHQTTSLLLASVDKTDVIILLSVFNFAFFGITLL